MRVAGQLMGLALGIPPRRLGIGRELVRANHVVKACRRAAPAHAGHGRRLAAGRMR